MTRRAVMITRPEESAGSLHNGAAEAGGSSYLPPFPLLACSTSAPTISF